MSKVNIDDEYDIGHDDDVASLVSLANSDEEEGSEYDFQQVSFHKTTV
jgi:hypothetical protein